MRGRETRQEKIMETKSVFAFLRGEDTTVVFLCRDRPNKGSVRKKKSAEEVKRTDRMRQSGPLRLARSYYCG